MDSIRPYKILLGIIILTAISLASCQEEIVDIDPIDSTRVVTPGSRLFSLVTNTSTFDGSSDDILDQANCTMVKLPVDVSIGDTTLTVSTPEDYLTVRNVMKVKGISVGDQELVYPVTLILRDHSEVIVNNRDELEVWTDQCEKGLFEDDDIECLDFVYPITIAFYDSGTEQLFNYTINSDSSLFALLSISGLGDYFSFEFPVQMILSDSTVVTAANNDELEDIIDLAEDACDEEDDYEDDVLEDGELITALTSGQWVITVFYDNEDLSSNYLDYQFDFVIDGRIDIDFQNTTLNGSWETGGDNEQFRLDLDFENQDPLDQLNRDWDLISFDANRIILGHSSGGGESSSEFLVLERSFPSGDDALETALKANDWVVDEYVVSDTDKTSDFAGFVISFSDQGQSSATDQVEIIDGTWLSISAEYLVLDYPDAPLDQLKGEWLVTGNDISEISLQIPRGDGNDPDILVLVAN